MFAVLVPTTSNHACTENCKRPASLGGAALGLLLGGLITSLPSCASDDSSATNSTDASYQDGSSTAEGGSCSPKTCVQLEAMCGTVPDGCGGTIDCGSCPAGQTCGGGGINQCGSSACVPKTCAQLGVKCGWTSDQCSAAIDCGECPASAECADGTCVGFVWVTGDWSSCSQTCGGGTRTRDVWCERADGQKVDSGLCEGTMPAKAEECNAQPCCTTDSMVETYQCDDGEVLAMWFSSSMKGPDPAALEECEGRCTMWSENMGQATWCCQFADIWAEGTWECRVYDTYSHHASSSAPELFYSSLGRCE